MAKLKLYRDFLERVNEIGFMPFSNIVEGLPSLTDETSDEQWHTGDWESDPWCWKDRAAEEKKLAYGCILGGHKGFVSPSLYSIFYTAYHPSDSMEDRRAAGLVSPATWELWRLFGERTSLSTSNIRRGLGATSKKGAGPADRATRELQRYYYITLSGRTHRMDKYGKPYGWAINLFERVVDWAPAEWLGKSASWSQPEACEALLEHGMAIGRNMCRGELAKVLGLHRLQSRLPAFE